MVKWKGFDVNETDWVELSSLQEDVPDLLQEYFTDIKDNGTKRQKYLLKQL